MLDNLRAIALFSIENEAPLHLPIVT